MWPLRRVLQANERLARAVFRPSRLAPDSPLSRARNPRVNGILGMDDGEAVGRGFDISSCA